MQPQSDQDYKELLTEVIKKQIVILGPDITLIKARNVPGLSVADDGTVTTISGEPQQITQSLIDQFVQLSGLIVKKTMEPLLMYRPLDGQVASQQPAVTPPAPAAQAQTQPTQPMPTGTQPLSQDSQPQTTPAAPVAQPTPTPTPSNPVTSEIDMDTQKIINDALKQT